MILIFLLRKKKWKRSRLKIHLASRPLRAGTRLSRRSYRRLSTLPYAHRKTVDFIVPDQEPAATRDSSKRKLLTPRRCCASPKVTRVENRGSVARARARNAPQPFRDRFVFGLSTTALCACTRIFKTQYIAKFAFRSYVRREIVNCCVHASHSP